MSHSSCGVTHVLESGSPAVVSPQPGASGTAHRIFLHTPEPFSSAALYVEALCRSITAEGTALHIVCPSNHQCLEKFNCNPLIMVHPTRARSTEGGHGFLGKVVVNLQFLFSSLAILFCAIRR